MDMTWIMTSSEFVAESHQNKTGNNKGKRSIWFNGRKSDKLTGTVVEHCKPQFRKYVASDFKRLVAT
jgi:hypothetical protein